MVLCTKCKVDMQSLIIIYGFLFLRKVQVQRSLDIHSIRAVAMQVLVLESGIKTSRNR